MHFDIRRRSSRKIVESGFKTRQAGKSNRDIYNRDFYFKKNLTIPENKREYYIARSKHHHLGASR